MVAGCVGEWGESGVCVWVRVKEKWEVRGERRRVKARPETVSEFGYDL
jgi:hypothetical protein